MKSGVSQGSALGPLCFYYTSTIYRTTFNLLVKFFPMTYLYFNVYDKSTSQSELNKGLLANSNKTFQWKMQFNPDPNKQAQEVYFFEKKLIMKARIQYHLNTKVVICSSQKHLGIVFGQQLNFNDHIQSKMTTCYIR